MPLYALLPAIRANVAKRVGARLTCSLERERPADQPERRRRARRHPVDVGITAPGGWRLTVRDAGGRDRRLLERRGLGVRRVGRRLRRPRRPRRRVHRRGSRPLPADGGTATASSADHRRHDGAPALRRLGRPASFSPNGDGQTGERHRHLRARREPATSVSASWTRTATSYAGFTAGGTRRARLHGHMGRPYRFRRRPDGRAGRHSTVSMSSGATQPATSPARGSRSPSTGRSRPRRPSRRRSPPTATAPATSTIIGFKLARKATVAVSIRVGDTVVRTLKQGDLAGRYALRGVGRTGRVGRVPRELATHLHRHRRLLAGREQRVRDGHRRPVPADGLTHSPARRPRSAPARSVELQGRPIPSAPRWT